MLEPASASAVGTMIATKAIQRATDNLAKSIGKSVTQFAKSALTKIIVELQIGFNEYLTMSYNKCRYFKTILNPNHPLEVVQNYVHVDLALNKKKLTDDELIRQLPKLKHTVVTGLAGSGKSMFMKYMTVCCFESIHNYTPLFVELRHLNSLNSRNLLTFIRTTCTSPSTSITQEQFELSLKSGALMLILDGFDELNHEYRDEVQRDVLALARMYPETTIVISSRPDDRFGSWSSFHVLIVSRLTKKQSLDLIKSLDYDSGVKRRFSRQVSTKLYDSHGSFLSSPLLTTIMLLTFEEFAEIPDKMHAFYAQAFDTLFQKHDAQKEQYQRKTHAGLSREDFRSCFAAFCALSYFEQHFSFDQDTLLKTAEAAVSYLRGSKKTYPKLTGKQVIDDLRESVCMLQPDGIEIAFVHRSFQEYFTAVFVTNLHGPKSKRLLDRCALRFGDSVLPMAYDMDRDTVEQEWVIPTLKELEDKLELHSPHTNMATIYSKVIVALGFFKSSEDKFYVSFSGVTNDVLGRYYSICELYPEHLRKYGPNQFLRHERVSLLKVIDPQNKDKHHYAELKKSTEAKRPSAPMIKLSENDEWWLRELGFADLTPLAQSFQDIRKEIERKDKSRMDILDAFV